MNKNKFKELLNNSHFLSLFYQARIKSEKDNLPLETTFMAVGLNKYKEWFPQICLSWGVDNLIQVKQFNQKVKSI